MCRFHHNRWDDLRHRISDALAVEPINDKDSVDRVTNSLIEHAVRHSHDDSIQPTPMPQSASSASPVVKMGPPPSSEGDEGWRIRQKHEGQAQIRAALDAQVDAKKSRLREALESKASYAAAVFASDLADREADLAKNRARQAAVDEAQRQSATQAAQGVSRLRYSPLCLACKFTFSSPRNSALLRRLVVRLKCLQRRKCCRSQLRRQRMRRAWRRRQSSLLVQPQQRWVCV